MMDRCVQPAVHNGPSSRRVGSWPATYCCHLRGMRLGEARFLLLSLEVWGCGFWRAWEDFGRVDGGDAAVGPDDDDPGRADR